MPAPRVLVLGLDCASPRLVFDDYRDAMPNLAALAARGRYGTLRSVSPPITVPAWACMTTGRDPGELGLYGFRNRVRGQYGLRVADARAVREPRIWDLIGNAGHRVAALHVPLTWPPMPVRGKLVSGFLAPSGQPGYAFPRAFEAHLESAHGGHCPDVPDFRTDDRARVMRDLRDTTERRFALVREVWEQDEPAFLMCVEMGPDRLHHAFWSAFDPAHADYDPDGPYRDAGRAYYGFLDAQLGALLERVPDDVLVLVVSDHGARAMRGGFAINDWLRARGDLVLKDEPAPGTRLVDAGVDWSATRVHGEGGYYARIFLNVRGRDPQGVIDPRDRITVRDELAAALAAVPGPQGQTLAHRIEIPEARYAATRGHPPDLLVYFGDLDYRSIGTLGHPSHWLAQDDRGPDGCNHDWDGMYIAAGPGIDARGRVDGASLFDVFPTCLAPFGITPPHGTQGEAWQREG